MTSHSRSWSKRTFVCSTVFVCLSIFCCTRVVDMLRDFFEISFAVIFGLKTEREVIAEYYRYDGGTDGSIVLGVIFDKTVNKSAKHFNYKFRYKSLLGPMAFPRYNFQGYSFWLLDYYLRGNWLAQTQICLERSFVELTSKRALLPIVSFTPESMCLLANWLANELEINFSVHSTTTGSQARRKICLRWNFPTSSLLFYISRLDDSLRDRGFDPLARNIYRRNGTYKMRWIVKLIFVFSMLCRLIV